MQNILHLYATTRIIKQIFPGNNNCFNDSGVQENCFFSIINDFNLFTRIATKLTYNDATDMDFDFPIKR